MTDYVYIDLDNVYSVLRQRDDMKEEGIPKAIRRIVKQAFAAISFSGYVKVFGNFRYLPNDIIDRITYTTRDWIYVDTPFINQHGKTCADGKIMAEILMDVDDFDRCILFTSDVDFYPMAEALIEKGCEVIVVSCGNVSPHLVKSCTQFIPVVQWGDVYFGTKTKSKYRKRETLKMTKEVDTIQEEYPLY